jgi:hypothetical protein
MAATDKENRCPFCKSRHTAWGDPCGSCEKLGCPNCDREVLSWDHRCPGCDEVPWSTPAGKRAVEQRRSRHWWRSNAITLAFLILVGFSVLSGVYGALRMPGREVQDQLEELKNVVMLLQNPDTAPEERDAARARLSGFARHESDIIREFASQVMWVYELQDLAAVSRAGQLSPDQEASARVRLRAMLKEEGSVVHWKAAQMLAELGDLHGIAWLVEQLRSGDEDERLLARMVLTRYVNNSSDWGYREWKRWWKENQYSDPHWLRKAGFTGGRDR